MSKERFSSIRYFLRKNINKLVNYRPSPNIIALILMFIAIFLLGGGIYDISVPIRSVMPYYRGFTLLYPSLHDQLLSESIAIMIIYALGTAGLILIYRSARYRRNPEQASLLTQLGAALLIIAFIVTESVLYMWKLGFGF